MAKLSLTPRRRNVPGSSRGAIPRRPKRKHPVISIVLVAAAIALAVLSISQGLSLVTVPTRMSTDGVPPEQQWKAKALYNPDLVRYDKVEGLIMDHTAAAAASGNQTLVILLGSIRGGEITWKSLYQNVLDLHQADLALMIGEVPIAKRNSSLYDRATYIWEFPEYKDWAAAIDLMGTSQDFNVTWRNVALKTKGHSSIFGPAQPSPTGSGAINYLARWFVSQQIMELSLLQRYSRFIISRSDNYHLCQHPSMEQLESRYIWLPEGEDYDGFTDRHLVLSRTNVLQALHIFPPVIQHPAKYVALLDPRTNPEMLTALRWKEDGIVHLVRRFPRTMFLAAQQGDSTRWRKAERWFHEQTPLHGIAIKYATEYQNASDACGIHWNYTLIEAPKPNKTSTKDKKLTSAKKEDTSKNKKKKKRWWKFWKSKWFQV